MIRKVENYMGPRGERLEVMVLFNSETNEAITAEVAKEQSIEEPLSIYAGVATIMSSIPGPDGQPIAAIPNELRFPIEASNPEEAISLYPSELNNFVEDLKRQQQEEAAKVAEPEIYIPTAEETAALKGN